MWLDVDICSFIHIQNLCKMDKKISEICFRCELDGKSPEFLFVLPHCSPLQWAELLLERSVQWASPSHPPHCGRCVHIHWKCTGWVQRQGSKRNARRIHPVVLQCVRTLSSLPANIEQTWHVDNHSFLHKPRTQETFSLQNLYLFNGFRTSCAGASRRVAPPGLPVHSSLFWKFYVCRLASNTGERTRGARGWFHCARISGGNLCETSRGDDTLIGHWSSVKGQSLQSQQSRVKCGSFVCRGKLFMHWRLFLYFSTRPVPDAAGIGWESGNVCRVCRQSRTRLSWCLTTEINNLSIFSSCKRKTCT